MTAGKPNYQKLYDMGRLPDDARNMVPGLANQDKLQKELDNIQSVLCEDCKAKVLKLLFGSPKKEEVKESKEKKAAKEDTKDKDKDEFKIRCQAFQCDYVAVGRTLKIAENNLRLHQKGKHPEMFKVEEKKKVV